jgi:histidinol-phosphatase (PHP family)
MRASCEAAIAAGITEIAFTDHIEHEPADESFGYYRYDAYRDELDRVREEFGGRLTILAGAEVDYNTRIADQVEQFLATHAYDFIIGSVHYGYDGEIIFPQYFAGKSLDDVFLPYYEQIQAAAETGWFDTIGHLDLPKRYKPAEHGPYDPERYRSSLQHIFTALIDRGTSFEINTSGLRQAPKASMPGPRIVAWYVEAGGTLITTGTDSHVPATIGAGLPETLEMLRLCGITTVSSFRSRQRSHIPIASLVPAAVL